MTNQALIRGNELSIAIGLVKQQLKILQGQGCQILDVAISRCDGKVIADAEDIEAEIKTFAVKLVTKKISDLEKEFKAL